MFAEFAVSWLAAASYDNVVRYPEGGYGYVPDMRGAYRSIESGKLLPLRTDDRGSRDVTRAWRHDAEGLDIVVVGNSFVDATALPIGKRFTSLLAETLNARVYNLGVQGQSLVNHADRALYADEVLHPEVVVLPLTTGADFADTSQVTFRGDERISWTATAGDVDRNSTRLSDSELLWRDVRSGLRRLWLVRIAHQLWLQISLWSRGGMTVGMPDCVGAVAPAPVAEPAFRLTEALIEDLHTKIGDRLILLMIPSEEQVTRPRDACDWDRTERWAETFAERRGLNLVRMLPSLRDEPQITYFTGGHLNAVGHGVVARVLGDTIAGLTGIRRDGTR